MTGDDHVDEAGRQRARHAEDLRAGVAGRELARVVEARALSAGVRRHHHHDGAVVAKAPRFGGDRGGERRQAQTCRVRRDRLRQRFRRQYADNADADTGRLERD
ncbi:hypothetical protein D3C83_45550 [compost metagenome]